MHEWRITESIIKEVLNQAEINRMVKIKKVVLSLGNDSDLTPDSINFCFNVLKNSPLLNETILEFQKRKDNKGIIIERIEGESENGCISSNN